jgi:hypothetical protein
MVGTSEAIIQRLELGQEPLTEEWQNKLGEALSVTPWDLFWPEDPRSLSENDSWEAHLSRPEEPILRRIGLTTEQWFTVMLALSHYIETTDATNSLQRDEAEEIKERIWKLKI